MRAKRSKKYRKIMTAYGLHFAFREPYQVLLDSHFLRACHAFHMPLQKFLENTLHGQCRIFVTNCTLDKITQDYRESGGGKGRGDGRPEFLPPPLELPMRHCRHRDKVTGEERGVVGEQDCLLDLVGGQVMGNEVARNKQHFVLATAEVQEDQKKQPSKAGAGKRGHVELRERVRRVPGVPIVYVKRSVMVLEEFSGASEGLRRVGEKEKFRDGLVGDRKRKRGDGDGSGSEAEALPDGDKDGMAKKKKVQKTKGPNPLSVLRKKLKKTEPESIRPGSADGQQTPTTRTKRRGKRGKKTTDDGPAQIAKPIEELQTLRPPEEVAA